MSWQNKSWIFVGILLLCLTFASFAHGESDPYSGQLVNTQCVADPSGNFVNLFPVTICSTIGVNSYGGGIFVAIPEWTKLNGGKWDLTVYDDNNSICFSDLGRTESFVFYDKTLLTGCNGSSSNDYNMSLTSDANDMSYNSAVFYYDGNLLSYPYHYGSTPYATSTPYQAVPYKDWLYVNCIIIFCLSMLVWGIMYSPFKGKS
jgi:hypothetical protein